VFVFDDLAPPRRTEQPGLSVATAVDGAFGGRDASFEGSRQIGGQGGRSKSANRPLRLATAAVAVLLVAAAAVTVVASSRHAPHPNAAVDGVTAGAGSGKSTSANSGRPARSGGSAKSGGGRSGSTERRSGSQRTKAATPTIVQPTAVTLYDATVAAPASAYQVTVSVSGNCWVEGEETTTSTDVWSGVLAAGEQHSFDFDGPVLLRIGAADATVTLDGTPVALPSGYQAPYNLTFAPS